MPARREVVIAILRRSEPDIPPRLTR